MKSETQFSGKINTARRPEASDSLEFPSRAGPANLLVT